MCVVGFLLHNSEVSTSKRKKQLRLLTVIKTTMLCKGLLFGRWGCEGCPTRSE